MIESDYFWYFFMLMGAVVVVAALTNWEWYFKQKKAQFFVRVFGRAGARIFYALLGGAIIYLAFMSVGR